MLKRLEIYGFKSFNEKIVLTFDSQLNGIVGPNGSGKSNIVDAIKWCIGEQALSQIRCKNALDVIFAGSETKSALNFCEVKITFDNSSGIFPIDYNEVEVARKLYRNGESEYYINRSPCRLKDIKDLILDTGLSSNGYAIIPQGKVEFVVSSKPEERRLLFEETAGVAKFKSRREEALRKLERVELDMARVEDILSYLRDQMNALENAVKKAKNYQKYKEELQVLDCANIVNEINKLDANLTEYGKIKDEMQNNYASLASELAQVESEIIGIKTEIVNREKNFLEKKDLVAQNEISLSLTSQKIESYKSQNINNNNNIVKLTAEIETIKSNIAQFETQILQINETEKKIMSDIEVIKKDYEIHKSDYEHFRYLITQKQNQIKDKNKELSEIIYKKASMQNDLSFVSKKYNGILLQLNTVRKEYETNKKSIVDCNNSINKIKEELNNKETQKVELVENVSKIEKEIEDLLTKINDSNIVLEKLTKRSYELTSEIDKLDVSLSAQPFSLQKTAKFIASINESGTKIYGPIKDLIKINNDYETLISSYLGNKLYWYIVQTQEDANKILEKVVNENIGYITLIVEKESENISPEELNSKTNLLDYISFDPRFEKIIKLLFSDISLNGLVLQGRYIIHGGSIIHKQDSKDLVSLERELAEVNENISSVNNELEQLKIKLNELQTSKNALQNNIIIINNDLDKLKSELTDKENYSQTLLELENTLLFEISKIEEESKQTEVSIHDLSNEVESLNEKEKELRGEIYSLSEDISQLQHSQIMDKYIQLNAEFSKLEEQKNSIDLEIKTKKELIDVNTARIKALETEIEELKTIIQDNESNIIKEQSVLEDCLIKKSKISEDLLLAEKDLENLKRTLSDYEIKQSALIKNKEDIQNQIMSVEIKINTSENNKTNLINSLNEKYNLSLDDARNIYSNIQVNQEQLEKLKKRVESLGAVNLAAPEEYSQLEQKYNTLLNQQQDLIKSSKDIKETISKINEQINTNFKETFAKVRDNFKEICKVLFEGGKADLVLTNEENFLETGVDILVQPPGKKLQNINLLSGGEKSLVALGLLFSFFMVKPAPICVLDEADAQLDEANVVRLMKLLKDFSKKTKFILITHVTRTMEFLETIYGVTMEELGVSKVISLKLRKQETLENSNLEVVQS